MIQSKNVIIFTITVIRIFDLLIVCIMTNDRRFDVIIQKGCNHILKDESLSKLHIPPLGILIIFLLKSWLVGKQLLFISFFDVFSEVLPIYHF